jgi:adenylate kinase family enzyme
LIHIHGTGRSAILVLGVPGSGKSTLCRSVSQQGHAIWFSASMVLRDYAHRNPLTTTTWCDCWARGQNAPDEEVLPVLWDAYVRSEDATILLDGYPRTSIQLRDFSRRGGQISAIFLLSVGAVTALSRITARSKVSMRSDDELDIAKQRIEAEWRRIAELLHRPEIEQKTICINAESDEGQVVADVLARLTA